MHRRRGERVDSMLEDLEADRALAREWGIRAAIFVPLLVGGDPIGVIAVNDRAGRDPRFSETDYRLVHEFADRAAIAIDLSTASTAIPSPGSSPPRSSSRSASPASSTTRPARR